MFLFERGTLRFLMLTVLAMLFVAAGLVANIVSGGINTYFEREAYLKMQHVIS